MIDGDLRVKEIAPHGTRRWADGAVTAFSFLSAADSVFTTQFHLKLPTINCLSKNVNVNWYSQT